VERFKLKIGNFYNNICKKQVSNLALRLVTPVSDASSLNNMNFFGGDEYYIFPLETYEI
jgi:hypothetical protein